MTQVLGNDHNENIYTPSFNHRTRLKIPNCTGNRSEWAEIKSSLLMQELTNNNEIQKKLLDFMHDLTRNLAYNVGQDLDILLNNYYDELKTSDFNDDVQQYPVAQSVVWLKYDNWVKLNENFYALVNFSKWLYIRVYFNFHDVKPSYVVKNSQAYIANYLTDILQQRFFLFIQTIRGKRTDEDIDKSKENDQIGIGNFYVPILKRTVRNEPDYESKPWIHPGKKCHVPYMGKYGHLMKEYNENNNFFGSVKCGISASTQYMLFMYLLSVQLLTKTKNDIQNDFRDLVTTICLQLVGDGGHTIREVLTGLISTIILFNGLINQLDIEILLLPNAATLISDADVKLNDLLLRIDTPVIKSILLYILTIETKTTKARLLFQLLLQFIFRVKHIISEFYTLTKDINIVGVTKDDIEKFFGEGLDQTSLDDIKEVMVTTTITALFNPDLDRKIYTPKFLNDTQLFFALDNNRYLLDVNTSFTLASTSKIIDIIGMYGKDGDAVISNVNKQINFELTKCIYGSPITERGDEIPFAFKTVSSKRKTSLIPRKSPRNLRSGATSGRAQPAKSPRNLRSGATSGRAQPTSGRAQPTSGRAQPAKSRRKTPRKSPRNLRSGAAKSPRNLRSGATSGRAQPAKSPRNLRSGATSGRAQPANLKLCKKLLQEKIVLNISEYKKGRYVSIKQAIAVSYSQIKKKFPECIKHLEYSKYFD